MVAEIGHEKAQSVIDSITSSYAAEGHANPLLQHPGAPGSFPLPPFGVPGTCYPLTFSPKRIERQRRERTDRYQDNQVKCRLHHSEFRLQVLLVDYLVRRSQPTSTRNRTQVTNIN